MCIRDSPNVSPDASGVVRGFCVGLVFAQGCGLKVSDSSMKSPNLTALLTAYVNNTVPADDRGKTFPFSSLQVNFNYAAKPHVDKNNLGPSYIISLGDHTGGELVVEGTQVLACHGVNY